MSTLTVSASGTAWIKDMLAQGKDPVGGWKNSPDAAHYASLDKGTPAAPPRASVGLPTSLEDLMKMQQAGSEENDDLLQQLQRQVEKVASEGISTSGNIINTKA